MLKMAKCVLMAMLDLIAPAIVVIMALAAFNYVKECNWLGTATCLVGSMIPAGLVYTASMRQNDMIEYTDEDDK